MKTLHLACVLDRSGSMSGTEKEVIGAYNEFIRKQKEMLEKKGVKGKVTLVLFDNQYEKVYDRKNINDVEELTESVYYIRGMTALYDAVGKTITNLEGKKNVIFFIETDGEENASTEYRQDTLKALVEKKKGDGWDFNFVGADLDTATTARMGQAFGIQAGKTMAFAKSTQGYTTRNSTMMAATASYITDREKT
jgi:uncharacterized protein YegL